MCLEMLGGEVNEKKIDEKKIKMKQTHIVGNENVTNARARSRQKIPL